MPSEDKYTPALFKLIAQSVAKGDFPEQYLFCGPVFGGIRLAYMSLRDDALAEALAAANLCQCGAVNVLTHEFYSTSQCAAVFSDGVKAVEIVEGVVVEILVRKLRPEHWRVLFSRVDADMLYHNADTRLGLLESQRDDILQRLLKIENALGAVTPPSGRSKES